MRLLTALLAICSATGLSADDVPERYIPPVRIDVRPGEIPFLLPGHWGTLRISAVNTESDPANLLCITAFVNDENLQFGRRIWVPPRSRLQSAYHVLAPEQSGENQARFDFQTLLYDADTSVNTPLRQEWGRPQQHSIVRIGHDTPVTIVLGDSSSIPGTQNRVAVLDFVRAARYENDLVRNLTPLTELPAGETALDAVDHLVIFNDDPVTRDLATLLGVRRWLYGGGRAWVMLDRVDPILLEMLLGDALACETVDRVGLTSVAIDSRPDPLGRQSGSDWSHDYDQPVELVRVLTSDVKVPYTVNGWPAAIWVNCGQGRLLITTLGANGWVRPRIPGDPAPLAGRMHQNEWFPGPPLQRLATDFFAPPIVSPFPVELAQEHVRAQVGYTIPSRSIVLGVLAGFVVLLVALVLRLAPGGRLEWIGVLGPVAAVVCGAVLIGLGYLKRGAMPATVATLQYVQPIRGTGDAHISGTAALFAPVAGTAQIAGTQNGWIWPDMTGMEETVRRLIWTDLDEWQWDNLPESPGLRTAMLLDSHQLPDPVIVDCQLDREGVVGNLSLPAGLSPSDGVLATRWGRIGVEFDIDGTFRATTGQVLTDEQFLDANVLSDEQVLRSRLVRAMLSKSDDALSLRQPTLLIWTERWQTGLQFNEDSLHTGSALVTLPVPVRRPIGGTEINIPAPLMMYREAIGPDGSVPVGLFDSRRLVWVQKHQPTTTWLQFQVPPSLLPVEPQAARVVIRVDGPVGKLSVAGASGNQVIPIRTWIDPVGTLELVIDDPRQLPLTDDGRLLLRVSGGDPERPELTRSSDEGIERVSYWKIESLTLELRARIPNSSE